MARCGNTPEASSFSKNLRALPLRKQRPFCLWPIRFAARLAARDQTREAFHVHGAGRFLILARDGAVEPNLAGVVKVTPRVAGKLTYLQASIGDTVRGGQVLATMTSTDLAADQAQYRQAGARVSVAQANGNLFFVDGSTFPFLPAKNITFTLMANAVRIAHCAF